MAGLTEGTTRDWAREAQGIVLSESEAASMARAIEMLAATARAAAGSMPFDSEPAEYLRAQRRWLGPRR